MEGQYIPDIDPLHIDINGVVELLKKLKPYKDSGPDEIPAYLLKETSKKIAPALTLILQASLQQSSIPSDWKKANVMPLFKKVIMLLLVIIDQSDSLTCICSKIL